MAFEEHQRWLQFRERVSMQYEDPLFQRGQEQNNMEQQDVIEMARHHWNDLDAEGWQALKEYRHAWQVLGGGPRVLARLLVVNAPQTPSRSGGKRKRVMYEDSPRTPPPVEF